MPTDPPLVDPKIETLPELCEKAGDTLEPIFPMIDSLHTVMGRYICWNKSNTMHVSQIKMCRIVWKEKMLYQSDHRNKL